jgi:hypothetical protein
MSNDQNPGNLPIITRRPFSVTLLAIMVLIITGIYLIRFIQTLRLWGFLSDLPGISPSYLAITGLFWTMVGLLLAWGLWRGRPGTPKAARIAVLAFALYYWLNRFVLANTSEDFVNWPFAATGTIILIGLNFWILSRPNIRTFFGEGHV